MDLQRWMPVPFAVTLGLPGVLAAASMATHGIGRFHLGEVASTGLLLAVAALALAGCAFARPRLVALAAVGAIALIPPAVSVFFPGRPAPHPGWTVPYVALGLLVVAVLVFLWSGQAWSAARAFLARFRTS